MTPAPLDFGPFEVITFDCYGTLIDWETGLLAAYGAVLRAHGVEVGDDEILERHAAHETAIEAGPYKPYREVLAAGLRGVCADLGITIVPGGSEAATFSGSVGDWPAFPDTAAALAMLRERYRLGVITNCDDDLFAASNRRLGIAFDWVVTAEQVRAYKPDSRPFEVAFERIGVPRERILHVAQSLFHDHVPAARLGLSSVWIDRRHDRPGSGATPPVADAAQAATFPDLASFARAATAGAG